MTTKTVKPKKTPKADMFQVGFRCDAELKARIEEAAQADSNRSVQSWIEAAVRKALTK